MTDRYTCVIRILAVGQLVSPVSWSQACWSYPQISHSVWPRHKSKHCCTTRTHERL